MRRGLKTESNEEEKKVMDTYLNP